MQKSVKESVSRTRSRGIIEFFCIESFPLAEAARLSRCLTDSPSTTLWYRVIRIRRVSRNFRGILSPRSRDFFFFIYLERGERYCLHAAQDFVKSRNTFLLFEIFLIYTYAFVIFKSVSSLLRNCVSYVDYPSFCEKSLSPKYLKNRSWKIFHTPSNFRYLQRIHHSFQYILQNCILFTRKEMLRNIFQTSSK